MRLFIAVVYELNGHPVLFWANFCIFPYWRSYACMWIFELFGPPNILTLVHMKTIYILLHGALPSRHNPYIRGFDCTGCNSTADKPIEKLKMSFCFFFWNAVLVSKSKIWIYFLQQSIVHNHYSCRYILLVNTRPWVISWPSKLDCEGMVCYNIYDIKKQFNKSIKSNSTNQ